VANAWAHSAWAEPIKLSGADIKLLLSDQTLVADKIEQIFQAGGLTIYRQEGSQSVGRWLVRGDRYCSLWPPSPHESCYDVYKDGTQITFISLDGASFPMWLKQ
jgi:hypothetical protein